MRGRLSPCLAQTRERALPKADPVPGRGTVPIVGKMLWKKPVIACWLSKTDLSSDADLSLRGALSAPILHTGHLRLEALLKMTQRGEPAFLTPGPAFYTHIHLGPTGSASSHGHPSLCVAHHTLSPPSLDPLPASSQISSQMCLLQQAFPELQARPGASSVLPPALQTCPVVATIWGDTDGCSSSCELHEAAPDEYG